MPYHAVIEQIETSEDCADYILSMARDFEDYPDDWKNQTLGEFLEAMAQWVEDSEEIYGRMNMPCPGPEHWKHLAAILTAARAYE